MNPMMTHLALAGAMHWQMAVTLFAHHGTEWTARWIWPHGAARCWRSAAEIRARADAGTCTARGWMAS